MDLYASSVWGLLHPALDSPNFTANPPLPAFYICPFSLEIVTSDLVSRFLEVEDGLRQPLSSQTLVSLCSVCCQDLMFKVGILCTLKLGESSQVGEQWLRVHQRPLQVQEGTAVYNVGLANWQAIRSWPGLTGTFLIPVKASASHYLPHKLKFFPTILAQTESLDFCTMALLRFVQLEKTLHK